MLLSRFDLGSLTKQPSSTPVSNVERPQFGIAFADEYRGLVNPSRVREWPHRDQRRLSSILVENHDFGLVSSITNDAIEVTDAGGVPIEVDEIVVALKLLCDLAGLEVHSVKPPVKVIPDLLAVRRENHMGRMLIGCGRCCK
jgi:hypothetical protein